MKQVVAAVGLAIALPLSLESARENAEFEEMEDPPVTLPIESSRIYNEGLERCYELINGTRSIANNMEISRFGSTTDFAIHIKNATLWDGLGAFRHN